MSSGPNAGGFISQDQKSSASSILWNKWKLKSLLAKIDTILLWWYHEVYVPIFITLSYYDYAHLRYPVM